MSKAKATCPICGESVDPQNGVALGTFNKALFAAHKGECAEAAKGMAAGAAQLAATVLGKRAPGAVKAMKTASRVLRALTAED